LFRGIGVLQPDEQFDVSVVSRHVAGMKVHRPAAEQPPLDVCLIQRITDLYDQTELRGCRIIHG